MNSSEIPTDLSINEEEWTDYLNMERLNDFGDCGDYILKDADNIVARVIELKLFYLIF